MIEIDTDVLVKAKKSIHVKGTSKRVAHYRNIETGSGYDGITPLEVKSIKGYTASGGEMSSRFIYGSEERESLLNYINTTESNAVGKIIHRGVSFSDSEWEKAFEKWTEPGSVVKNDRMSSFTLDRKRAPIHGSGDVKVILSIKNKSGVDISKYSVYPEEAEVLTQSDFSWKVISADILYGTTWHIEGEEV